MMMVMMMVVMMMMTMCAVVRGVATAEWEERPEPLDHSDPWSKYFMNSDWVYTVQVEEAIILPDSLQGNATIELRSPTQGSLCGRRFPVDVSIVFFAWLRDGGQVETGLCEPNSPWEDLDDWERELITEHIPDYCANKDSNRKPPEP
nr:hypothetical protein BaRGS_004531 [Batillaria attramentaria]